MRQRRPKDLDKRIDECSAFLLKNLRPGTWERGSDDSREPRDLYVEIGCGKGDFILAKAIDDPASDYLGIEGLDSVLLRGLEKAMWVSENAPIDNLKFACLYVGSMKDLFAEGSLAGIYLNFSDPWPKKRHYKRRLTWRGRLNDYAWALRPGGFIEIKTDNDPLFEFTLEEIEALGWEPEVVTRDLHSTELEARRTMTEYERKFHGSGKNINYLKLVPTGTSSR